MIPAGLAPIEGAPGYFLGETGKVHRLGHPKLGAVCFALKPTAEIAFDRTPGAHKIRRTGRWFFPVEFEDGHGRVYWTPPADEIPPIKADDADDDDWPF